MNKGEVQKLSDFTGSTPEQIVQVGMPARERLEILANQIPEVAPRQINVGETIDPFGLLEHEDTYEPLAAAVFLKCEGIYRQLSHVNDTVKNQIKNTDKNSLKTVILPKSTLTDLYQYQMVRTESETTIHYLFHRTDRGYEDRGFRVVKQDDGHIILKSADPENTDIQDNDKYHSMLVSAQRWVEDYSAALHINPILLKDFSKKEVLSYNFKSRARRIGQSALQKTAKVFLAERKKNKKVIGRRPRISALAASMMLAPLPFTGITAEGGAIVGGITGTGSAIGSIFESSPHKSFDDYHIHLPKTSEVVFGQKPVDVYFDGTMNPFIEKHTPSTQTKGRIMPGTIRKRNFSFAVNDVDYGILPGKCDTQYIDMSGDRSVRVATPSAVAANSLKVSASNTEINVCNTSNVTVYENDAILFIEPRK